jgi:putative ABC transport system permease protein
VRFGGVVLAYWLSDIVAAAIPVELPFWIKIEVDAVVLAFTVLTSAVCALLAGSLPALRATRVDVAESLKRSGAGNTGATEAGTGARDILTVTQVAVSVVLLVGAALVLRSMVNLSEVDPGFDPQQVLVMEVNPTMRSSESAQVRVDRFTRLAERIARLPGVASAASNNSPPFHPQRPVESPAADGGGPDAGGARRQSAGQLPDCRCGLLHAPAAFPLQSGRVLRRARHARSTAGLHRERRPSRSAFGPGADPLGKRLVYGKPAPGDEPDWMTVVGVVRDVRHQALDREAGPDLYKPATQLAWKQMHFVVRAQDGVEPMSLVQPIRREGGGDRAGDRRLQLRLVRATRWRTRSGSRGLARVAARVFLGRSAVARRDAGCTA